MIFTLCGSARFEPVWHEANKQLGLAGHISFSLMTFPSIEGGKTWYTDEQKRSLDLAHLAKINASGAVFMLNVNAYLGESSLRELEWARLLEKDVYWLENDPRVRYWLDNEFILDEITLIPEEGVAAIQAKAKEFSSAPV